MQATTAGEDALDATETPPGAGFWVVPRQQLSSWEPLDMTPACVADQEVYDPGGTQGLVLNSLDPNGEGSYAWTEASVSRRDPESAPATALTSDDLDCWRLPRGTVSFR